jgi:hypothetical protein
LCLVDFVGRQAIEEVVAGVEFADMVKAEKLPAAFTPRQSIRPRRAEFAGKRTARMLAAGRLGPFDAAVQPLRSLWRFRRFGGDGRRSLVGE